MMVARLIFLLILSSTSLVFAQKNSSELTPLISIVKSSDYQTDPTRVSYVLIRCSAMYVVTGAALANSGDENAGKEMAKYGAILSNGSMELDRKMYNSRNPKSSKTNDEWLKTTSETVGRISKIYILEIQNNLDRTGDYFSEDYKSDLAICKNLDKYSKKN